MGQRVPKKIDPMRTTARQIIIKMPKVKGKEKILKAELPIKEFL